MPDIDRRVASIISEWESLPSVFDDIETYTGQIKELVEIGKPAVPALATALDRTIRDTPMRLVPFTLRAIGDARAVPALIRAIPRTLLPPGSDCGMSVRDAELLKFMQANDLHDAPGDRMARRDFDMGRPVREVCGALRKITGTNQNDTSIFSTFLDGGDQQRAMERKAFDEVARRWANWWKDNWSRFVEDPALADVRLPAPKEEPSLKRFLTGPSMKVSGGESGMIVTAIEKGSPKCCLALGLNRTLDLPKELSNTNTGAISIENVSAWAARAGADLLGTQYRDLQSGKLYYCVRTLGLQAWEVPNRYWTNIEQELQRDALPPLDCPAGDLLMHFDTVQHRYAPERRATFLFITRDGMHGMLRVMAQVTRLWMPRDVGLPAVAPDETEPNQTEDAGPYLGVKLDYKFFYAETDEMKAEARAREQARAARDVERQRRKIAKQMETYSHLSGTVYLPNGETASNAAILLPVQGESAVLGERRFEYETYSSIYRTASNGAFVIPEIPSVDLLYLAHEEGFCEFKVDHPQSPLSIHLLPWGRLEGVVTLEGKQRQKNTLHFGLAIEANGSFRINDVPPGTYELRGELREGGANNLPWAGKVLGRVNQEVLVLERAPDKLNEPLDLGEMVLQLVKNLKPGDAAPDFEIENLDGSSVRLADFRGKCLLLDFWATWCGPCRAETPHLKAVYDTYGKNPKFTMLGLSLDKAIEEPKGYSKTEGIAWQQGFLGDWSKATLPARYGVEGIPAICLVDPAGKIVATDLRGAEIGKAVAEALEEAEKASTK